MSFLSTSKSLAVLFFMLSVGCGHQPRAISSAKHIYRAPAFEHMITINDLPLSDWPKLQKFEQLEHLSGVTPHTVADRHIEVFATLKFPKLRQVSLANCFNITDRGIALLTNFPSIQGLHLAGTSISDEGIKTLATGFPNLKEVNLEQCKLLTKDGLLNLTNSTTIKSVNLSLGPFSQNEIEMVIASIPNVTWWTIRDQEFA